MRKKIILLIIPALFIIIGVILYCLIPVFVKSHIKKKISEIEKEKNITLTINTINITSHSITGKIGIDLNGISLQSNHAQEALLAINKLHTEVQAWRGFHFTKSINEIDADSISLQFIKAGNYCNYRFSHADHTPHPPRGYNRQSSTLLDQMNRYCPDRLTVKSLEINTDLDSICSRSRLDGLSIKDGRFNGLLTVRNTGEKEAQSRWQLCGIINKKDKVYSGEMSMVDTTKQNAALPRIIRKLGNSDLRLRDAHFTVKVNEETSESTRLTLAGEIEMLQFYNRYVSKTPILIEKAGGNLNLSLFEKEFQVDSTSTLRLNQAVVHPYINYTKKESNHLIFKINEQHCNAQQLFASLPDGLFTVIPEMKVHGDIDYFVLFDCDFAHIENLKFDFGIRSSNRSFGIDKGEELITRFNEPFDYLFYDKAIDDSGEEYETEMVIPVDSSRNPYFCHFAQIPPHLTNCILISEDPSFFHHRGYLKEAIRNAMIADIKAHKMIRGGSTISQQLVKNLFLNRNKVLTRKIEELLLVWMIEDYDMIEKERMFEIYVNIIEWAPQVIGIGKAAEFYFGKKPDELTLNECAYLATLIRSPKSYPYTIDDNGVITSSRQAELKFIIGRMEERGLITPEEAASFNPRVQTRIADIHTTSAHR